MKTNLRHPVAKWLFEAPLTPAWRKRLELTLGVVATGAAVVALSSTLRPDPAKLAERLPVLMSSPVPYSMREEMAGYEPHPLPSTELRAAVEAGDAKAMSKAYTRGMMLDGLLRPAARSGKKAAVAWLLDHGANVHEDELTPYAPVLSADAYPEISALLLQRGAADPNLENAAAANAPNAATRALAKNPVLGKSSNALFAVASAMQGTMAGKHLIMTKLLDAGADPNHGQSGMSPLAGAVGSCDYNLEEPPGSQFTCMSLVRLLLKRGAYVSADVLSAALALDDSTRAEPLDAVLDAAVLDKVMTTTALANASKMNPEDAKRLIKRGGVEWAWHDGEADAALPVLEAARHGDRDTLKVFLDAGGPVDMHYKDGLSALGVAIDSAAGDNATAARVVELLVTRGADVNRRLPDGRTPLFAAAESGDLRIVNFLIAKGARVNDIVLDDSPLDAAEANGHQSAARVIHAHGGRRAPRQAARMSMTW
ncbi:MAG: ankyrin repeat domain-containing protein [Labilithrix sp.]